MFSKSTARGAAGTLARMHKTDAPNNVAGEFSDGTPPLSPGTSLGAKWHNTIQRELVNLVETKAGLPLDDGNDGQVVEALDLVYGQLAADNTFSGQNTFGGLTTFDELITASGGISVGASAASLLSDGTISTGGSMSAQGTITGAVLESSGGTNGLRLKPGSADHVYAAFYARTASPNTRSAYIGFAGAADTFLSVVNEISGGVVKVTGGTAATGASPTSALELTNGHLKLSGAAPNSNAAVTNLVTPGNILKARAKISTDGAGNATINAGTNVSSVSIVTGGATQVLRLSFAASFANANYTVVVTGSANSIGSGGFWGAVFSQSTGSVDIRVFDQDGSVPNLTTTALTIHVHAGGDQ